MNGGERKSWDLHRVSLENQRLREELWALMLWSGIVTIALTAALIYLALN